MKFFATIALAAISTAAAQDSHSHSHSSECTAETLTAARNACDSVADVSQLKCDSEACHEALHTLVEDETRQCYVELGLGPVTDLDYYTLLDEFCHGDGADPADLAASSTTGNSTSSGTSGTTVGDHDDHSHDHDHDHDHDDHSHDHSDEASGSASSSSSAATVAQSLMALQLMAIAAVTMLV